jgi:hypothetical protein
MGIPQVPEHVRRAPTMALRAVFAGIGRILMSADRTASAGPLQPPTSDNLEQEQREQQELAARPHERSSTAPPAPPSSRWRSLDQTGNVRLLSAADVADDDLPPPAAGPVIADRSASEPALPLANYESLSLASIRARLRGLDVPQLKVLLDYEARNAERPEVLGMFERRIEKLESGG